MQSDDQSSSSEGEPEIRSAKDIHKAFKITKQEMIEIKVTKNLMNKTQVLYENFNLEKPYTMSLMNFIFMARRAIIISLIFFS